MKNKSYSVLILAGVLIVLLVTQKYFYLVNLLAHSLIDLFAIGRSLVKVELFLLYAFLLCMLALLPKVRQALGKWKVSIGWLMTSIGATYAYGMVLLLVFFNRWGFTARDYVITLHNNELSSTMLLHNHLMKGVNALFLGLFHAAQQENADAGLSYIGLLPAVWYYVGAALFLISAVLLILKFIELYELQAKWRNLFIIIYSITSFSLLKNMLDGGILNTESPAAIAAIVLILLVTHNQMVGDKESKKKISYWWTTLPLIGFGVVIGLLNKERLISMNYFYTTILSVEIFAVAIVTLIYWQLIAKRRTWLGVGLGVVSIILIYTPVSSAVGTYINSQRIIGNDGAIVGLYQNPNYGLGNDQEWKQVEKINDMAIYEVHPGQPTQINELLQNNHLLANLLPIHLPGITCNLDNNNDQVDFTLVTQIPLPDNDVQHKFGNITNVENIKLSGSTYKYRVTILLAPCAPRPLNMVQELLKERGLETFFLVNISERYNVAH